MRHKALVMIAPVFTSERFTDPRWARPGRTLYYSGSLRFLPTTETVPLLVDHEDEREIGTVHRLTQIDWTDGPWIAASVTVDDPPAWLKRNGPASFGMSPYDKRDFQIREHRAEIVAAAFVNEVSVLSPTKKPAEPRARILTLSREEPPAAREEVFYGGRTIIRPSIGQVLGVR
jgi:hypothetical protein